MPSHRLVMIRQSRVVLAAVDLKNRAQVRPQEVRNVARTCATRSKRLRREHGLRRRAVPVGWDVASGAQIPAERPHRPARRQLVPLRGPCLNCSTSSSTVHRSRRTVSLTSARTSWSRRCSKARSATARAMGARDGPGTSARGGRRRVGRTRTHPVDRSRVVDGTRTRTICGRATLRSSSLRAPAP